MRESGQDSSVIISVARDRVGLMSPRSAVDKYPSRMPESDNHGSSSIFFCAESRTPSTNDFCYKIKGGIGNATLHDPMKIRTRLFLLLVRSTA